MTSVLERSMPSPTSSQPTAGHRLPGAARSGRPLAAAVSALAVLVSIAVFAGIYASARHTTAVLVVTRTIEAGQPITGGDLSQVSASVPVGVSTIPVSAASQLAGKRAEVTIPAGSLLSAGDVTGSPAVANGDAVVGVALKPGQLPSVGLVAGDQVMIVLTASPGTPLSVAGSGTSDGTNSGGASTGVLVAQASVFDVQTPPAGAPTGDTQLVSVAVSSTLAASVATAAAADQVSLVLLPGATGGGS